MQGTDYVCPPTPPPDLDPVKWWQSIDRLQGFDLDRLYLTHFGEFRDVDRHLADLGPNLDEFLRIGTDALDAYVTAPGTPFAADAEPPARGLFSSAAAFCRLPLDEPPLLLRSAVLCVGEAIALGLDASEPPFSRRAFATSLWWLSGLPTPLDLEAVDALQRSP
jgi:hypothetical protein